MIPYCAASSKSYFLFFLLNPVEIFAHLIISLVRNQTEIRVEN